MDQSRTGLHYHLILGTEGRIPYLDGELRTLLYPRLGGIVRKMSGKVWIAGGVEDHLHILASLGAERSVYEAVEVIKRDSSLWIRETFPALWDFAWQPGFSAFTVSRWDLEKLARYIAGQEEHHRRIGFREELRRLSKAQGLRRGLWRVG